MRERSYSDDDGLDGIMTNCYNDVDDDDDDNYDDEKKKKERRRRRR